MADQLATPSDLASLLQRDVDTASATLAIEAATAVVQAAAGQRIVRVTGDVATIDLDYIDRERYLYLPEGPVVSVASVLVGATAVTDFSSQLSRGRLWRSLGWLSATPNYYHAPSQITVTYTHGLLATDQRIQLARQATLGLAAAGYSNPTSVTREQIDDYAVAYEAATARMEASPSLGQALRRQYGRSARSVRLVAAGDN